MCCVSIFNIGLLQSIHKLNFDYHGVEIREVPNQPIVYSFYDYISCIVMTIIIHCWSVTDFDHEVKKQCQEIDLSMNDVC